ncbi:MAG: outer membrane beta-barrel protein [Gemmatimonadota bacterium]
MNRLARRATMLAALAALVPALAVQAQGGSTTSLFKVGYMDIGPTIGLGGIGDAGIAFGGRFERGIKALPDLANGVLGIELSADIWSYNNPYTGGTYDFRYTNIGVTANYHFEVKSSPKFDPFFGLGLGNSSVSTDAIGSYSSGLYFIGRAGVRYFAKPRLALYADAGAGASTLNVGVTFGIGSGK